MSEAPSQPSGRQGVTAPLIPLVAVMGVLAASSLYSYLLFHTGVELARAATLISLGGLVLVSWRTMESGYLLVYGTAALFATVFVVLHTLTYQGMGIFPGVGANLPTQLWLASRLLESLSLVAAAFFTARPLRPLVPLAGFGALSAALLAAIFLGAFPVCFVEGEGLTPFKVVGEYVVAGLYLAALLLLLRHRTRFAPFVLRLLLGAIACSILAELAFTLYSHVFGGANLVGHLFVFASTYLAYWAILVVGVTQPQALLFRELAQREEVLAARVAERTRQLEESNAALIRENAARCRAEEALSLLNTDLQRRVSEELAKNREKDLLLIQQSRLAAMGEMIGNIAHQWRQPLNALGLLLANIKDSYDFGELTSEEMSRQVESARHMIDKMSSTIDDFRDFFRPDKEKHPFSLRASLTEVKAILGASLASHGILLEEEGEDVTALGYPNEFAQVLLNLLNNAKEALLERKVAGGRIRVRFGREEGWAVLRVTDNGGGVPEAILPKIFDPYFTTKAKGTGIGLYMSKVIVENNMGGAIEAHNVTGGAEFLVRVPCAEESNV